MRIALGADHAGYKIKEMVKKHLLRLGHQVEDFGTTSQESVDYPDYAFKVAESVVKGDNERGILFCWTGNGMCICANKVRGVRAAVCLNEDMASLSREHNQANILCLGSKFVPEDKIIPIVDIWLRSEFIGDRHERRVNKIKNYEGKK
jgi:ribose 5-phosphate isomerase B